MSGRAIKLLGTRAMKSFRTAVKVPARRLDVRGMPETVIRLDKEQR